MSGHFGFCSSDHIVPYMHNYQGDYGGAEGGIRPAQSAAKRQILLAWMGCT